MARVFICGMPGSGKSTLGKELSRYVSHPFFDLDHLIEDKEGQKIGEIFKKKGEGYFRNIEQAVLKEFISDQKGNDSFICSLGGGTPCFFDNMGLINHEGVSLFIDVDLGIIKERMLADEEAQKRPLIASINANELFDQLEKKYTQRKLYYNQAQLKIKGDEAIATISSNILSSWQDFLKRKTKS